MYSERGVLHRLSHETLLGDALSFPVAGACASSSLPDAVGLRTVGGLEGFCGSSSQLQFRQSYGSRYSF